MKHASLFSGIGAPELAACWLGWENVFHCEINPFCRQVLKYWFDKSESYEDITKTDFKKWHGEIDVLTGGFPCQPFSVAGRRKGTEDDRYLWPEFKRTIREVRPRWVVGENVAGIISMVQPGKETDVENSSSEWKPGDKETLLKQHFVIETICCDLEREGYSVQPIVIPACAVGAPHRRDRVWFIAHNNSIGFQNERTKQSAAGDSGLCTPESSSYSAGCGQFCWCSDRTERSVYTDEKWDSEKNQWERSERKCRYCTDGTFNEYSYSFGLERGSDTEERMFPTCKSEERNPCRLWDWENFPTQSPICGGDDGISMLLDADAVFKGINRTGKASTYNRWRTETIKAYGNAMVPQVIFEIYRYIDNIEHNFYGTGIHSNI